jgi:benzoylformate decarboxylase
MFGNPGSSEEGLLDEISRFPDIQYILGLQEAALVLIANGYALATQKPTVVQLHCSPGVGNALGSLYQVFRKQRSPLVVIAGEAGAAFDALDAHMALDLVTFARPVTKYANRAIHSGSLLRLLRRCIKMAATPPVGPTFLVVPQDILDQPNDEPVVPTVIPDTRVAPEPSVIAHAAGLLAGAENPVIIMGDGVSHAQAQAELAQLAEVLGAGVWGAMASEINIPWTHPLYRGLTEHMFGRTSARTVASADPPRAIAGRVAAAKRTKRATPGARCQEIATSSLSSRRSAAAAASVSAAGDAPEAAAATSSSVAAASASRDSDLTPGKLLQSPASAKRRRT